MENRTKGQRREKGVCWCCCHYSAKVRPCTYWVNGQTRMLCKDCERTQAVVKPKEKSAA